MIDRYSRKELKVIWSEENKYKIWLDIEIASAAATSTSNQILYLFSSDQISVSSFLEYLFIIINMEASYNL